MAEAARTVKHYVSDCLEERYPYDASRGFAGQPTRDAGKVFNGFAPFVIDDLLNRLSDPAVNDSERAKAVHHLYAYSASQETKMQLVQKEAVPLLVAILRHSPPPPPPPLEQQCFLVLRSLCTVPQGCYPVVRSGGLEAALHAVHDDDDGQRHAAREAAAHMLFQLSASLPGRQWMLAEEGDDEGSAFMSGLGLTAMTAAAPRDRMDAVQVVHGLLTAVSKEPTGTVVGQHLMGTIAQLSSETAGITACLGNAVTMATLAECLDACVAHPQWSSAPFVAFLADLLCTVWNLALDEAGLPLVQDADLPERLFRLFALVSADPNVAPRLVQRHLMGALSAVYKLSRLKLRSVEPLGPSPSRVHALVEYLRGINTIEDTARHSGVAVDRNVIAISKNTVQCVRLASEVRAVREITHRILDELAATQPTEAFYLRRQLYFSTAWEAEYDASV